MAKVKKPKMTRYMLRCPVDDLVRWNAFAQSLGFASAGAWLQRIANEKTAEATRDGWLDAVK